MMLPLNRKIGFGILLIIAGVAVAAGVFHWREKPAPKRGFTVLSEEDVLHVFARDGQEKADMRAWRYTDGKNLECVVFLMREPSDVWMPTAQCHW